MSFVEPPVALTGTAGFRIGFSADFCGDDGRPVFPDIGLSLLEACPMSRTSLYPSIEAEYFPAQLAGYDVLISLKPKVTAQSVEGIRVFAPLAAAALDMTMWT